MIGYTPTPDYYNDYIQHGWVKDSAAKVHKYIKRWRNAAGKWVYKYKTTGRVANYLANIGQKHKISLTNRKLGRYGKLSYGATRSTYPYYWGGRKEQVKQARKNAAKKTSAMRGDSRYKAPAQSGYAMNNDPRFKKKKRR